LPRTHRPDDKRAPPYRGWTEADVLDFEYHLQLARDGASDDGLDADRDALAGLLAPEASGGASARRELFRAWLELRRHNAASEAPSPGQLYTQGERLLRSLAWMLGLLLGAGVAGIWLSQATGAPVNAPLFWAGTVGLQLLLLLALLVGWVWRRRLAAADGLHAALEMLIARAGRLLTRTHPGETRDALRAAMAKLTQGGAAQRALLLTPAAALAQRFAIAYNAGLLLAMLALHLPMVDLRFGWQSTYPVDAARAHAVVQVLSAPWSWAAPQAMPRLDAIAATRYSQGQPAYTLPAEAAHAWWPFLVASVLVYGLLPRLLLLLVLRLGQRRRLAGLRFDQPAAHALWRRLHGPLFNARLDTAELPSGDASPSAMPAVHAGDCVLLIDQEATLDVGALRRDLSHRAGWQVKLMHPVAIDNRVAADLRLAELAALQPRPAGVVVALPAARDPIVAVALFLRALMRAAGPGVEVLLLLVGADAQRLQIWRRFAQIQGLALNVEANGSKPQEPQAAA
jgi:hypothetical protein